MKPDFLSAARDYFTRGWCATPLGFDTEGRPKRPLANGWQHPVLDWDAISALPWAQAEGVGVVLGSVSSNVGAIDIDDVELADEVWRHLEGGSVEHYFVSTIRKRGHLYLTERIASPSTRFEIEYHGRKVTIELKGNGTQVAAPPTPGYAFLGTQGPAYVHDGLSGAWAAITAVLGLQGRSVSPGHGAAGYPRAWATTGDLGERNNALYVESCRLAEAGMPLASALETMTARVQVAYKGTMDGIEIERTVRSAYRRARKPVKGWV